MPLIRQLLRSCYLYEHPRSGWRVCPRMGAGSASFGQCRATSGYICASSLSHRFCLFSLPAAPRACSPSTITVVVHTGIVSTVLLSLPCIVCQTVLVPTFPCLILNDRLPNMLTAMRPRYKPVKSAVHHWPAACARDKHAVCLVHGARAGGLHGHGRGRCQQSGQPLSAHPGCRRPQKGRLGEKQLMGAVWNIALIAR